MTTAISPAYAQAPAQPQPGLPNVPAGQQGGSRRDDVKIMEVVLTNAVKNGADTLARQMQIQEPGSIIVTGTARARGFVLDGYGVFFIVDVPMMKQSVVWSNQVLLREQRRDFLRQYIANTPDSPSRRYAEQMLRSLDGPPGMPQQGFRGRRLRWPHSSPADLRLQRQQRRPSSRRLQGWPARRTFPIRSPALRRCGIRTSCTPRP